MLLRPDLDPPLGCLISLAPGTRRDGRYFRTGLVLSWAGMRGVVTLAAAFLLPPTTPHRDTLVFIALVVTVGTLLIQGLTLPWLARWLDVHGPDPREDALQTATVLQRAVAEGNVVLSGAPARTPRRRSSSSSVSSAAAAPTSRGSSSASPARTNPAPTRSTVGSAGRCSPPSAPEVLRLRDTGTLDHEVLDEVMRDLDLEESMLDGIEARTDRLQERMILTPEPQRGDCEHLRAARVCSDPQTPEGCADCLREGLTWVHLRLCLPAATSAAATPRSASTPRSTTTRRATR